MGLLSSELQRRGVPSALSAAGAWDAARRAEALRIMAGRVFGRIPPEPVEVGYTERAFGECELEAGTYADETHAYIKAGEGVSFRKVAVTCRLPEGGYPGLAMYGGPDGSFSFDVMCLAPKLGIGEKAMAVVAITGQDPLDSPALPIKYVIGRKMAIFAFRYRHIVNDYPEKGNPKGCHPRFDDTGLDRLYYGDHRLRDDPRSRRGDDPGTIAFWAWGASRAMDYVQTQGSYVDLSKVAVSGHSRLGKTAAYAGANDERFGYVMSNASGAGGATLSKGAVKEDLGTMAGWPIQWFCENLRESHGSPDFDMHFLLSCIAPRRLYVANSDGDVYCDQDSGYLACVAASEAYEAMGLKGFTHPDRMPATGDRFHEGDIGYHLRAGGHSYLTEDWGGLIDFMARD